MYLLVTRSNKKTTNKQMDQLSQQKCDSTIAFRSRNNSSYQSGCPFFPLSSSCIDAKKACRIHDWPKISNKRFNGRKTNLLQIMSKTFVCPVVRLLHRWNIVMDRMISLSSIFFGCLGKCLHEMELITIIIGPRKPYTQYDCRHGHESAKCDEHLLEKSVWLTWNGKYTKCIHICHVRSLI